MQKPTPGASTPSLLGKAFAFFLNLFPDRDDAHALVDAAKRGVSRVAAKTCDVYGKVRPCVAEKALELYGKARPRVEKAAAYARDGALASIVSVFLWMVSLAFRILDATGLGRPPPPDFEVCSATVFCDDGRAVELTMRDAVEIANFEAIEGGDSESDDKRDWIKTVREWAFATEDESAEFETWRLEIRYKLRGAKYRAVARPGEPFPKIRKDVAPVAPKILKAYLERSDGTKIDITPRYLKFMGPLGDWHGGCVTLFDLFPNDDNEFFEADGKSFVSVIDNRLNVKRLDFARMTVVSS
jgi:hypothetical protein